MWPKFCLCCYKFSVWIDITVLWAHLSTTQSMFLPSMFFVFFGSAGRERCQNMRKKKKLWTLLNIFISLSVQHLGWLIFFCLVLSDPPSAVVLYTDWTKKPILVWLAMAHNLVRTSPPLSAEILCIQCAKMRFVFSQICQRFEQKMYPKLHYQAIVYDHVCFEI